MVLMMVMVVRQLLFYYVLPHWRNNPQANYRDGTGTQNKCVQ